MITESKIKQMRQADVERHKAYVSDTLHFMRLSEDSMIKNIDVNSVRSEWGLMSDWDLRFESELRSELEFRDTCLEDLYDAIQGMKCGIFEDNGTLITVD